MKVTRILVALFIAGGIAVLAAQQVPAPIAGDAGTVVAQDLDTALPNANRNRSGNKVFVYGVFEDEGMFQQGRQIRKKWAASNNCPVEVCVMCRRVDGDTNAASLDVDGVKGASGGWVWDCRTARAGQAIPDNVVKVPAGSGGMVCTSMIRHSENPPSSACAYNETTLEQGG